MPIGGKLVLKGGETLQGGVKKKKKKKKDAALSSPVADQAGDQGKKPTGTDGKVVDATAINIMSGKNYEQEFEFEVQRMKEGKTRSTPWGSSYRAPPEILHGYSQKVTGKNAEERLDLRCAKKADKFCK